MKSTQLFFFIIVGSIIVLSPFHSSLSGQIPEPFTVWKFPSEDVHSTPLIVDSVVYFGSQDGLFFALHKETGEEIWRFDSERSIYSNPVVYQDMVLVKAACKVFALDRESGNEIWSYVASEENPGLEGNTQYDHSSPIVHNNIVYFGDDWGNVSGVDASNGELKYRYTSSLEYEKKEDGYIRCTPSILNDIIYFGDWGAHVYAVSLIDSSEVWIKEVYHTIHDGSVISEMVIKDSILYFGGYNNNFSPMRISDGEALWTFTDGETFVSSTPIFHGNHIIMGTTMLSEKIHCLNTEDGSIVWSFQANGVFFVKPIIIQDTLLVINSTDPFEGNMGVLYFLDIRTGAFINEIHLPQATESSAIANDSTLIVGKGDGLYCINYLPYLQPNNVSSIVFVDEVTDVSVPADQAFNFRYYLKNEGIFCDTVSTSSTIEGNPSRDRINFRHLTNIHLRPNQTSSFEFSAGANKLEPGEYRINLQVRTPKPEENSIDRDMILTITEPGSTIQFEAESSGVRVFPNPFTNTLSFQLSDTGHEKNTLTIYTSLGTKIYETTYISSLNKGLMSWDASACENQGEQIFFYCIRSGNEVYTGRILKKGD